MENNRHSNLKKIRNELAIKFATEENCLAMDTLTITPEELTGFDECAFIAGWDAAMERVKPVIDALEFYSNRENFTLIFDSEDSSRAELYEQYKRYSIGDYSLKAKEALAKFRGEE